MPTPINRNEMLSRKEKKDEEIRIEKINRCVKVIYNNAVNLADTSTNTVYSFDINPQQQNQLPMRYSMPNNNDSEYQFYKDNMTEILINLWGLFPGCTIKLAKMCTGNDGKRYDISTIDEKMLPFINKEKAFECIVVDWS